ncbi:hypothetical protein H6F42_17010 [Pseudanabaena sp. FACHB-1998]|uniref:hypothetical protein n=1 Tax=Pseudanabaena sp. FACHB-1998 TaxID=2692858 RepID=UPI00167FE42C|nr:hypothetical protein [Pseudanabaena sp. FACHB-1998]MBD2178620.1 hypothetical protein [Pseudanabaena sp. FACHB-1998]
MKLIQLFKRLLVIVAVLVLVTFVNVAPVSAVQSDTNQIIDNLPMPNIQKKSEDILKTSPYDTNPEYTSGDGSNQGLNEVQGTADFDKMNRSRNEKTPPIVKQAEKAFNKVGDKMSSAGEDTKNGVDSALDKAGDAINSLTGKASDAAESIKDKIKS